MTDRHTDLSQLWTSTWEVLARGPVDPKAASRFITLASIGLDATPQQRLVVLRAVDRKTHTLTVFTDADSSKCGELRYSPNASLLVWDPEASLQVRLAVTTKVRPGTKDEWAAIPQDTRSVYGGHPLPGTPIEAPKEHIADEDFNRFLALEFIVLRADILHLGRERHCRALFEATNDWTGTWIAP